MGWVGDAYLEYRDIKMFVLMLVVGKGRCWEIVVACKRSSYGSSDKMVLLEYGLGPMRLGFLSSRVRAHEPRVFNFWG